MLGDNASFSAVDLFQKVRLKYPNVRLDPDLDNRVSVVMGMERDSGYCPCQLAKVTCLECASVKKVSLGKRSKCHCGVFIREDDVDAV